MIDCAFENGRAANLRHCVVDTIVLNEDRSRILLVKRSMKLDSAPGKWAMPGGFVDRDEIIIEAAEREVLEETGYKLESIKFINIVDNPDRSGDDRQNITFIHIATVGKKIQEPDDESDEIKWFDLYDLPNESDLAFDHYKIIKENIK